MTRRLAAGRRTRAECAQLLFALALTCASAAGAQQPPSREDTAKVAPPQSADALPAEDDEFGASATVSPLPRTARRIEAHESRTLPGAFGDPFRAIQALPGVTPLASGLPYVYVRGAPPASTLYYYDDVPLPSLFHIALGPAVIHPAMLGAVELYSGVPPARYGRHTGGVIAGQRRVLGDTRLDPFGELELRAIDLNGLVFTPLGNGGLTIAGRYGYPGPVVSAVNDGVRLDYWDYQLQLQQALGGGTLAEVSWFGAYDLLETSTTFESTFHRLDLRLLRREETFEYGGAILLGYDATRSDSRSVLDSQLEDVRTQRAAPRMWLAWRNADGVRVRVGADMVGVAGKLRADGPQTQTGSLDPSVSGDAPLRLIDEIYASASGRNAMGAYAELSLRPLARVETALGARADLWLTGSNAQQAVSPRAVVTYFPTPAVDVHAGIALGYQPAVFLLPLPGVADIALTHGLQSAVQTEVGAGAELWDLFRGEVQLYAHRYANLLFPELALEAAAMCARTVPIFGEESLCDQPAPYPRASALAYGLEVMLRSSARLPVSGWLTYTLGRATAETDTGLGFTPSFDLRHVANLVLRYRVFDGFSLGARSFVRSGQVISRVADTGQRVARRLPGFYRLDARAAYAWTTSFAELELSLEWMNLTFTREPLGFSCGLDVTVAARPPPDASCRVRHAPALVVPNLGLRAQF